MKDKEFQKAVEKWSEAELASAPDLRPTPEMVGLVRAKEEPRRARTASSRWALAAVAAASILLIVALSALILRSGQIPGYAPAPEATLIAQRVGPDAVQTTIVQGEGKGTGAKGPARGRSAFRQLLFEVQRPDSAEVLAVDLLNPPAETVVLTPADNYRLALEPLEERHVYAYQYTSSGSLVQVFPNPAYNAAENPLLPGEVTRIPAEPNWLYLDGAPGEERLYVLAAAQPLRELEKIYAEYVKETDEAVKREHLLVFFDQLQWITEMESDHVDARGFVFRGE